MLEKLSKDAAGMLEDLKQSDSDHFSPYDEYIATADELIKNSFLEKTGNKKEYRITEEVPRNYKDLFFSHSMTFSP